MKMPTTTLAKIRAHAPCESGWRKLVTALGGVHKYGEHTPITLMRILDSNGLDDALWALRACDGSEQFERELVCDFAERVLPIFEAERPGDRRVRDCIETARRFARGQAGDEELAAARDAAWAAGDAARAAGDAAGDAAGAAAWVAAWVAAEAAAWVADGDAARAAERAEQERILRVRLMQMEDR